LTLLAAGVAKDHAVARWDQLRACAVAVFDYTGYRVPDYHRPIELAVTGPTAAVSYELGIALTLGRAIGVIAEAGQDLPFDVDIAPVRLQGDGRDEARVAEVLEGALYGSQRGGGESSLAATRAYLDQSFSGHADFIVSQSVRLLDDSTTRDAVK